MSDQQDAGGGPRTDDSHPTPTAGHVVSRAGVWPHLVLLAVLGYLVGGVGGAIAFALVTGVAANAVSRVLESEPVMSVTVSVVAGIVLVVACAVAWFVRDDPGRASDQDRAAETTTTTTAAPPVSIDSIPLQPDEVPDGYVEISRADRPGFTTLTQHGLCNKTVVADGVSEEASTGYRGSALDSLVFEGTLTQPSVKMVMNIVGRFEDESAANAYLDHFVETAGCGRWTTGDGDEVESQLGRLDRVGDEAVSLYLSTKGSIDTEQEYVVTRVGDLVSLVLHGAGRTTINRELSVQYARDVATRMRDAS